MIVFTREESMTVSSPRHAMQMHVRVGAMRDGTIRAIDMHTLSNSGAYGEHGPTTVGLSGHKSIPLYTHNLRAFRFSWDVVYTNTMSAGRIPRLWRDAGTFCRGIRRQRAGPRALEDPAALREKEHRARGRDHARLLWRTCQ